MATFKRVEQGKPLPLNVDEVDTELIDLYGEEDTHPDLDEL